MYVDKMQLFKLLFLGLMDSNLHLFKDLFFFYSIMLHLFCSVLDLIHTAFFSIVLTVALAVPILPRN